MNYLDVKPFPGLKVLVPGDMHCPWQDTGAIAAMCDIFAQQGNRSQLMVIVQGDMHEASALSKHSKSVKRQQVTTQDEIDTAFPIFKLMYNIAGAGCYFIPGNHEQRAERFAAENPGTTTENVADYWQIPDGWVTLPWRGRIQLGPLTVCHGDTLKGSLSMGGPQTVLRRYPARSTLYGHTHRIQAAYHTTYNRDGVPETHGAWSVGHLTDVKKLTDMGYGIDENWQKGFAIVHFYSEDRFSVSQYIAHGNTFFCPATDTEVSW